MSKGANHNSGAVEAAMSAAGSRAYAGDAPPTIRRHARHIYVHIPFCARICPYCAFYKTQADPTQTARFCEALLRELAVAASLREARVCGHAASRVADTATSTGLAAIARLRPRTIFFGGGTPTALTSA